MQQCTWVICRQCGPFGHESLLRIGKIKTPSLWWLYHKPLLPVTTWMHIEDLDGNEKEKIMRIKCWSAEPQKQNVFKQDTLKKMYRPLTGIDTFPR